VGVQEGSIVRRMRENEMVGKNINCISGEKMDMNHERILRGLHGRRESWRVDCTNGNIYTEHGCHQLV
jgi:hypothetical protein